VNDSEGYELSFPILPLHIQIINVCTGRASSAKLNRLVNIFLLAFEHGLNAAVRKVSHPTSQSKSFRAFGSFRPEEHALYPTAYVDVGSRIHVGLICHGTADTENQLFSNPALQV
jgi:hypothetical protein